MAELDLWAGARLALDHWLLVVMLALLALGVAGALGRGLGIHNLFRDDAVLHDQPFRHGPFRRIAASPAFWTHAGLALLTGLMAMGALDAAEIDAPRCEPSCMWPEDATARARSYYRLALLTLGAGGLFLGAAWVELRRPREDLTPTPPAATAREMARALLGLCLGAGAIVAAAWGAQALAVGWLAATEGADWWRYPLPAPMALIAALALGLLWWALASPKVPPCLALFGLIAVVAVAETGLRRLAPGLSELAAMLALLWIGLVNGRPFRLTIPGLEPLYARPVDPNAEGRLPGAPKPIPILDALEAWAARERARHGPDHRPRLALLATSGGAYRATFWTALLLDRIAAGSAPGGPMAGLADAIRLVTGASGGMVAGAYFTAMQARGEIGRRGIVAAIEADVEAFQASEAGGARDVRVPRDSLTPVAQALARHDLPSLLFAARSGIDRGRALDQQWATLACAFADIAEAEAEGRAPSLILSPMLIESGAPAFISNLDLKPIRARSLGFETAPALTGRRPDQPDALSGPGALRRGAPGIDESILNRINRESVELFDAFPQAWRDLSLATAVRLNASFPYVSPAVSLPTLPGRRVVDAGYYDNYGVDLAAAFLLTEGVRDWIAENCSAVAVIQARAFPSASVEARRSPAARAFSWLTSPLEAVFRARASTQLFRNNQALRVAERDLREAAAAKGTALRFQSFVFEAAVDASMSWSLPRDELEALEALLAETPPAEAARAEGSGLASGDRALRRERLESWRKIGEELRRLEAFWRGPAVRLRPAPSTAEARARTA